MAPSSSPLPTISADPSANRWASRLMPKDLMVVMRHADISTTMKFYVSRNAQSTAALLWDHRQADGNTSGNIAPNEGAAETQESSGKVELPG
jgi:hypothetical protein